MKTSWRHRCEWALLSLLRWTANLLPSGPAASLGGRVGWIVGRLWRRRRMIACGNVQSAFPELTPEAVWSIVRSTFDNLGRTAFEIMRLGRESHSSILSRIDTNGAESLKQAAAGGKGALLLTGHFGNWELLGGWIRAQGYPVDFVVKPARNPLVDRMYNSCRRSLDVGIIHTQVATRGIVRALQQGRFVAILADQYAGREGIEVEFFGRMVSTPRGPATLALKYGCPLLTGVLVRRPAGRFFAHIDGPVTYQSTGDHERDVFAITQEFTRRLENHIRSHPDQWLWTHRRWRD